MTLSDTIDEATPKRMLNRKYVFAISTLAAFLLIVALIEPTATTIAVSQATITVPELGARGANPHAERIQSMRFLRDVEELARLREEHIRIGGERQIPVCLPRDTESRSGETLSLPAAVGSALADVHIGVPSAANPDEMKTGWHTDQQHVDEQNHRIRNPEYDMSVRALVRSQAERQELLTRLPADHASIRRVEVEIGELELLISHTEQYLPSHEADRLASLSRSSQPLKAGDPLASFDESAAIESIRQSAPYPLLNNKLSQAQLDLQTATDPAGQLMVSRPPELVNADWAGLCWSTLLTVVAISSLMGFVVSKVGNSTRLPDNFYSVEDVARSLKIPVIGQLEMDSTPEVLQPERIANVRYRYLGVRLSELLATLLVGAFVWSLIAWPSLWGELLSRPLITYMRALQELRSQIPLPYLFK